MTLFVTAATLIIASSPAHAYIDAGSGSYMLQMSLAAVMTAVFTAKLYWQKIKSFALRTLRGRESKPTYEA